MNTKGWLELLNGSWLVLSLSLAIICSVYLRHEILARSGKWKAPRLRHTFTLGMRVATGLMVTALGIFMRSAAIFLCRCSFENYSPFSLFLLLAGGMMSVLGFVCTIREISRPLYGNGPWLWTVGLLIAFVTSDLAYRFA